MGEKFGRIMNYGDGVYSGQYVGALYAEAYFETDMRKVIERALDAIPEDCLFAEMVHDMLRWSLKYKDWEDCFEIATKKYWNPDEEGTNQTQPMEKGRTSSIDVRGNMAYVLMGLLYGENDFAKTVIISTRCGMDSDCNPSTAAGVLLVSQGFKAQPQELTSGLNRERYFQNSAYNFDKVLEICEKLVRRLVVRHGGKIVKGADDKEEFVIRVRKPVPSELQNSWTPGPLAGSRYTDEETSGIIISPDNVPKAMKTWSPSWVLFGNGYRYHSGMRMLDEFDGKKRVLKPHTYHDGTLPCGLLRYVDIPEGKDCKLSFSVKNYKNSSWRLKVVVDFRTAVEKVIDNELTKGGWYDVEVDLNRFAGKEDVLIELLQYPQGKYQWGTEFGYWADLDISGLER